MRGRRIREDVVVTGPGIIFRGGDFSEQLSFFQFSCLAIIGMFFAVSDSTKNDGGDSHTVDTVTSRRQDVVVSSHKTSTAVVVTSKGP